MLVLALDTSSTVRVALHDGVRVLASRVEEDSRRHTELLTPAVAAVLAEAGVDRSAITCLAVGTGPAPFTGLRVGLVTAQVLGAALEVPVHGVCSLDALLATAVAGGLGDLADPSAAADGRPAGPVELLATGDARRREVHWARYRVQDPTDPLGGWTRLDGPHVGPAADLPALPACGAGARLYADVLDHRPALPDALDPGWTAALVAHRLAGGLPQDPAEPLYLRRPDAVPPPARTPAARTPASRTPAAGEPETREPAS